MPSLRPSSIRHHIGLAGEATRLLESIWQREANSASAPNFARIVKDSANNIRDALMSLETELLAI